MNDIDDPDGPIRPIRIAAELISRAATKTGASTGEIRMVSSINRRSFMSRIIGGAALSGTALSLVTGQASAQSYTGRSDSDPSDRAGYGHNQTGYSDSDSTDAAG